MGKKYDIMGKELRNGKEKKGRRDRERKWERARKREEVLGVNLWRS